MILAFIGIGYLALSVFYFLKLRKKYSTKLTEQKTYYENCLETQNELNNKETAELKLKLRTAENLAIVTDQSQNAIMLMNAKGDIEWVNDSFSRLYEYSYEEFTNTLGNNIRKTSFNPLIHERLNKCINQHESVTYEALNITKTGKEIWTHTSLVPLVKDNELVGMVTIDSDVNKRIKTGEYMAQFIVNFNEKISYLSEQLNTLVELTDALFERIEISQNRMNRTEQILSYHKEISDKIKILGLNASIEAHIAGTAGVGFRVISNEIVTISNSMLNSLKEISELVSGVKRSSEKLGNEKEKSELAISKYKSLITELKEEINSVGEMVLNMN
jgi:PAS domain S-box-containing protein